MSYGQAQSNCLNELEMADLIGGRLSEEARARAWRHLAECELCHEVYLEAQALLADMETSPAGRDDEIAPFPQAQPDETSGPPIPKPLPFRPRKQFGYWLPAIAAGLIVGIGLAVWKPAETSTAASWARLGELSIPNARDRSAPPTHEVDRGPGRESSSIAADFRLGVEWAHLGAVWLAGDRNGLRATAIRLQELKNEGLPADVSDQLDSLLQDLSRPDTQPNTHTLSQATLLTPLLAESMTPLGYEFDLGRFAETGRLAAEANHFEFFLPNGPARSYLDEMLRLADERMPVSQRLAPEARRGLEEIAAAWPASADPLSFEKAAQAFTSLILSYEAPRRS